MKKFIAAALSSTALLAAPAVFAQAGSSSGDNTGGDGGLNQPGGTPPLTPSQVETSDGAVHIPPPLDHSGNAKHVSEKGVSSISKGGGDHGGGTSGHTGNDGGSTGGGSGAGAGGDSGSGEGDSAGAGAGTGN